MRGWSGVSPDAGKPPREEVATPVPIAGDVEGTGTGSIRASSALPGNQLVRDLIRDSTVPSLSLAVNFPPVADRALDIDRLFSLSP
jgi:hypothetical protein